MINLVQNQRLRIVQEKMASREKMSVESHGSMYVPCENFLTIYLGVRKAPECSERAFQRRFLSDKHMFPSSQNQP